MKDEGIKIRIDTKLKEEFKNICEQQLVTMSDKVYKFIKDFVNMENIKKSEQLSVKINDSIYVAKKKDNQLILNLNSDSFGYLFFKKWKNESYDKKNGNIGFKKDYAKSVDFIQNDYSGVFEGVFVIDAVDGFVILSYDNEKVI